MRVHTSYVGLLRSFGLARYGQVVVSRGQGTVQRVQDQGLDRLHRDHQQRQVFTFVTQFGVYQLAKLYVTGALSEMRVIQKVPVAGSVAVYRNGRCVKSAGVASLRHDRRTRDVFAVCARNVTAGHGVGASTTQITLASGPCPGLAVGGLLYLSGLGSRNTGLLNGRSESPYQAIAAAQMYTLSVNTSSKTITPSTGMGSMYVQPADVLTWAGQFDVPVRFDTDEMQAQIIDKGTAGLVASGRRFK